MRLWSFIILFNAALGLMLAPENLVILGQQAGAAGRWVFLGLAVAAALHFFTARTYGRGFAVPDQFGGDIHLSRGPRSSLTLALFLAARGGFALWGSTALLVTAGYVFNEIFWPAYPNLGFSFTLLALLLVLNLLGTRVAAFSQVVFAGVALAGMAVLVVMGLLGAPAPLDQSSALDLTWQKGLELTPIFLFPFIGYELAGFLWEKIGEEIDTPSAPMLAGIIAVFGLYSLWCLISLRHVPLLKLQESTVPYAYVARAVGGEPGLLIIGAVLLAGALAAANALLLAMPIVTADLPASGLLPVIFRGRVLTLLLLGVGIALALALGLGGSPNLPRFVKASLLLWLLTYARQHLATWLGRDAGLINGEPAALSIICALALIAAVVLALITDPERAILGLYMFLVVGSVALVNAVPYGTGRNINQGIT